MPQNRNSRKKSGEHSWNDEKKNKVQGFIPNNSIQKKVEIHHFSQKLSSGDGPVPPSMVPPKSWRVSWAWELGMNRWGSWGWPAIGTHEGFSGTKANRNTTKKMENPGFSMQLDRCNFWYSSKSKSQNEAYFETVDWVWLSLEKHAWKRRMLSLRGVPEDKECMTTKGVVLRVWDLGIWKTSSHQITASFASNFKRWSRKPRQTFVADGISPVEKHIFLNQDQNRTVLTETFFHDEFQRYENKQFEQSEKAHLKEIQEEAVHSDHNMFFFNLLPKAIRPLAIKSCLITRPCSFGEHTHTLYREKKFSYLCIYLYTHIIAHNYTIFWHTSVRSMQTSFSCNTWKAVCMLLEDIMWPACAAEAMSSSSSGQPIGGSFVS